MSFINTDGKINEILAKQIQKHIIGLCITHRQVGLIQGMQGWVNIKIINQHNTSTATTTTWLSRQCRKHICPILILSR
jgi:hypothetical protein